jgi:predicted esterase
MRVPTLVLAAAVAGALLAPVAPAQQAPAPPQAAAPPAPPATPAALQATRADLARSYIAFERLLKRAQDAGVMTTERTREVNLAFERATRAFFGGGLGGPASELDAAMRDMLTWLGTPVTEPGAGLISALRVRVAPPIIPAGAPDARVGFTVGSLYDVPDPSLAGGLLALRGVLIDASGKPHGQPVGVSVSVVASAGGVRGFPKDKDLDASNLAAGEYAVALASLDNREILREPVYVMPRSPEAIRAEALAEADKILGAKPDLARAVAVFRSRAELLTSTPNPNNAAQALADPIALAVDLEADLAALRAGRNPYARRPGDHWRTFDLAGASVPARVYVSAEALASPAAGQGGPGLPLVIALHGAGGDENMFFDGYGAGELVRQAAARGFIAVSPANSPFAASPLFFDSLVDQVARDFPVDRSRVYAVGHSLGSGVVAAWANQRANALAAAACIAGFSTFRPGTTICPVLVVAGELDVLIPVQRIETGAKQAQAAGLPVEYRFSPNHGHTLVVGAELPGAIEWLLTHTKK